MRIRFLFAALMVFLLIKSAYAVQSTITEAEGYSCMGDDKSRKQTEQTAMIDAKKNAAEYTATYIQSETQVKDFALQKDLVTAYTDAQVTVIEDLDKEWYKDPSAGDCYKIKIKAEVTPDQEAMKKLALASAGTSTAGSINVPVAPPPVPGSESSGAQGTVAPDVVVVPSGTTYVYMAPNTTGVYFYNGFWYRYYEGYWFRSMVYGRRWDMVPPAVVPRVVVNVPPEYPRYLPPAYNRIHYNDLRQHWHEWDRNHEWNKHEWFKNELKPEVIRERQAHIQQEREDHRLKRERIRQTNERRVQQQQEKRRPAIEHKRQETKQQVQRNRKPDRPGEKKGKAKEKLKKEKEKKQIKTNKVKKQDHEKKQDPEKKKE